MVEQQAPAVQQAPAAPQEDVYQQTAQQVYQQTPAVPQSGGDLPNASATDPKTNTALPNASVADPKTNTASGRPKASAFTKEVKPRSKVAEAPFWWASMVRAAPSLFTHVPAEAIDDSSEGSAPVQAYAALLELVQTVLRGVPGDVSVAELRLWSELVKADIANQPSAAAINQIRDALFG